MQECGFRKNILTHRQSAAAAPSRGLIGAGHQACAQCAKPKQLAGEPYVRQSACQEGVAVEVENPAHGNIIVLGFSFEPCVTWRERDFPLLHPGLAKEVSTQKANKEA